MKTLKTNKAIALLTLLMLALSSFNSIAQEKELKTESDGFKWYELTQRDKRGAQSVDGTTLIPLSREYTFICYHASDGGWFSVEKGDKKWGVCDITGREIIAPGRYDVAMYRNEDGFEYIKVTRYGKKGYSDRKEGVCDMNGKEIIAPKYDNVYKWEKHGYHYFNVERNGKDGACDMNGREMVKPKYEWLHLSEGGVFEYKNSSGEWVSTGVGFDGYDKFYAEGHKYFKRMNYSKAAESYKKALAYEQTASAYYNVGVSYYNMRNYDDAITYFQGCLNSNPSKSLEKDAQDRINESRQYMAQQEARREEAAAAIIGGLIGVATGAVTGSMGVPANDPDYQAWMNYRNSGLPGASTISFEDFKRANARAAANGYQIGSTTPSYNNQSTGQKTKDCPLCHHSGKCNTCNGTHRFLNVSTGNYLECPNCKPDGKCSYCNGTGSVTTH